ENVELVSDHLLVFVTPKIEAADSGEESSVETTPAEMPLFAIPIMCDEGVREAPRPFVEFLPVAPRPVNPPCMMPACPMPCAAPCLPCPSQQPTACMTPPPPTAPCPCLPPSVAPQQVQFDMALVIVSDNFFQRDDASEWAQFAPKAERESVWFAGDDARAFLKNAQSKGCAKILAEPRMITLNNRPATLCAAGTEVSIRPVVSMDGRFVRLQTAV